MPELEPEILKTSEAKEFLRIDHATLLALVRCNLIPHTKLGPKTIRFSRGALREWMAGRPAVKQLDPRTGGRFRAENTPRNTAADPREGGRFAASNPQLVQAGNKKAL